MKKQPLIESRGSHRIVLYAESHHSCSDSAIVGGVRQVVPFLKL